MIAFDRTVCGDLGRAQTLEWLETNGIGGFSSSTITGLNTRRYHGLLTAATQPPVGRFVLLSKMEETLLIQGKHYDLATNRYTGAVYPEGFRYLTGFRLDPFPKFTYQVEGVEVEKRVFMVHSEVAPGENTVVIEYAMRAPDRTAACTLELRPLIAFRDYHGATEHNNSIDRAVRAQPGSASVTPYHGLPTLHFAYGSGNPNAAALEESGDWYFNFEYTAELERGLDGHEDLFNPFVLRFTLRDGDTATVIASTQTHAASDAPRLKELELNRRRAILDLSPSQDPLLCQLAAAADQFIVQRGDLHSVIAGYHWFADWGRDTMISLPGLTLATGRPEIARDILQAFAASANQGMLPNSFPDAGASPEYNTVDAALWLFEAVRSYLRYTGDQAFVRERLYPKLKEILDWHVRGTRYGIHVDSDGLLACGEPGVQLTWMDAKVGDWVVTPREGKPVEVQALWYNALRIASDLAHTFGDAASESAYGELAQKARQSFTDQFWNADSGCLYDVVDGDRHDASLRPNQIFAVSLCHTMLSPDRERQIVEAVERDLLTPAGLRSLSPHDPNYRPHYQGNVRDRDSAYHQGTVWPWLIGPFISAYVKVHGRSAEAKQQASTWLRAFEERLTTYGLGQISEIADGEAPHTPRGCVAQAWSVAELLRAAVEDVYEIPPR